MEYNPNIIPVRFWMWNSIVFQGGRSGNEGMGCFALSCFQSEIILQFRWCTDAPLRFWTGVAACDGLITILRINRAGLAGTSYYC